MRRGAAIGGRVGIAHRGREIIMILFDEANGEQRTAGGLAYEIHQEISYTLELSR